ncbi:MAG: lipid-A-disaccharide synthase [Thermoproteota archaeon]|jgi:lipid-A-disaccharide synthase
MSQSCLIIAGEKSGQDLCMSFLEELKEKSPGTDFFGVGGYEMEAQGVELFYRIEDFSSMGFSTDVLKKIPFYFRAMDHLIDEVKKRDCKTAILIDFQGFNLKMSRKLKDMGVNVLYYVAPQVWSWKEHRIKILKRNLHTLFAILPFEKEWFAQRGLFNVKSVEHPLLDKYRADLNAFKRPLYKRGEKLKVLILPGSRNSEAKLLLKPFLKAVEILKHEVDIELSLVRVESVHQKFYDYYEDQFDKVYSSDDIVSALKDSHVCIASSGTVTLTCAMYQLPTVVCYRMSLFNVFVIGLIRSYKGPVSLGNIILNKWCFPELLQDQLNPSAIAIKIRKWISNDSEYAKIVSDLADTKKLMAGEDIHMPDYISKVIRSSNS